MKTCTRTLKVTAARCLDAAMRAVKLSNVELAVLVGCAESRVRRWRSDDDADLDAAPPLTVLLVAHPELATALLAEIHTARGEDAQAAERTAIAYLRAESRVEAITLDALGDGIITAMEAPAILEELDRAEAAKAAFRTSLEAKRAPSHKRTTR